LAYIFRACARALATRDALAEEVAVVVLCALLEPLLCAGGLELPLCVEVDWVTDVAEVCELVWLVAFDEPPQPVSQSAAEIAMADASARLTWMMRDIGLLPSSGDFGAPGSDLDRSRSSHCLLEVCAAAEIPALPRHVL